MKTGNCVVCGKPYVKRTNRKTCGSECAREINMARHRPPEEFRMRPARTAQAIPGFPGNLDRDRFGAWLSGFSDGEATLGLRIPSFTSRTRSNAVALFRIALRDDDAEVLRLSQSFWQCGRLSFMSNARSKITNAKPVVSYGVQSVAELMRVVIPHFEQFPLRSKKRHDFSVWRRGVELMSEVQNRPSASSGWTNGDRERFRSICAELVAVRQYTKSQMLN